VPGPQHHPTTQHAIRGDFYLQLKHLGYEDVRIYNGGWSHWGNELTLPVVEGSESYGGDFAL
jgi:thiosulfate/3-mercaptopyruvate sulfurtransferase